MSGIPVENGVLVPKVQPQDAVFNVFGLNERETILTPMNGLVKLHTRGCG